MSIDGNTIEQSGLGRDFKAPKNALTPEKVPAGITDGVALNEQAAPNLTEKAREVILEESFDNRKKGKGKRIKLPANPATPPPEQGAAGTIKLTPRK